jgi:hypothetical protein
MIDVSGRLAMSERITSSLQVVDVSSLARGLYTVELVARNAAPQRTKVLLE